jgi:hypothetical protein
MHAFNFSAFPSRLNGIAGTGRAGNIFGGAFNEKRRVANDNLHGNAVGDVFWRAESLGTKQAEGIASAVMDGNFTGSRPPEDQVDLSLVGAAIAMIGQLDKGHHDFRTLVTDLSRLNELRLNDSIRWICEPLCKMIERPEPFAEFGWKRLCLLEDAFDLGATAATP